MSDHSSSSIPHGAANDRFWIYALFFISGFCALLYQVAWQRILGLFCGSDSISAAIVIGAFLLGLGCGSLVATGFADRLSPPRAIIGFGFCELGISAFAIASKYVYYDLIFREFASLGASRSLAFIVVFISLLLPTTLMGMSLPLLSKACVSDVESAPDQIAWLYGINTLGAAFGSILGGCLLIGTFGYYVTILLSAALSLTVGVGALASTFLHSRRPPLASRLRKSTSLPDGNEPTLLIWCALVFVSGFSVTALELIWFRIFDVFLQALSYSFSIVIGLFLVGDAIGIILGNRTVKLARDPKRIFFWLQSIVALYAVVSTWLFSFLLSSESIVSQLRASISGLFFNELGRLNPLYLYISASILIIVIVPPAVLMGMTFPIAQKSIQRDLNFIGTRVGFIQLANILGNTFGSIVTGLVLFSMFGVPGSLRIIALIGAGFVSLLLLKFRNSPLIFRYGNRSLIERALCISLVIGLLSAALIFPDAAHFWAPFHNIAPRQTLVSEDSTGMVVAEVESPQSVKFFYGGKVQSGYPFSVGHMILGLLGPLIHPHPKSILVVGSGSGGTPWAAGIDPLTERIHLVEIQRPMFGMMHQFDALGGETGVGSLLKDQRFHLEVADARHVLFTQQEQYDVIESDAVYPHASFSGLLNSSEYFHQLRKRLNHKGICVQYAPTSYVQNSFRNAFPYVEMVASTLVGSAEPIEIDLDGIINRLRATGSAEFFQQSGIDVNKVAQSIKSRERKSLPPFTSFSPQAMNTDLFPKDEFYLNRHLQIFR